MKSGYQLIDFGRGRKLESWDGFLVDRPCPAAEDVKPAQPSRWNQFDARFEIESHHRGAWQIRNPVPDSWWYCNWFGKLRLTLTEFGHLGVFPEQELIWTWLKTQGATVRDWNLINGFAYTGGTTLAAAQLGNRVTHIDSAKNIVRRASENARESGLVEPGVRWIVDDIQKYLERQLRREARYDGFFIDPPTFGHGTGNQRWQIDDDLSSLLRQLGRLCDPCKCFVLTCHSPGYDETTLKQLLVDVFSRQHPAIDREIEMGGLLLIDEAGRQLPSGYFARWLQNGGDEKNN